MWHCPCKQWTPWSGSTEAVVCILNIPNGINGIMVYMILNTPIVLSKTVVYMWEFYFAWNLWNHVYLQYAQVHLCEAQASLLNDQLISIKPPTYDTDTLSDHIIYGENKMELLIKGVLFLSYSKYNLLWFSI